MTGDIELGRRQRPSTGPEPAGYSRWASWIASDPDSEPFIFRKFDELGALNLLYLQSDMIHLEAQLKELDIEGVRQPDIDSINATRQWEALLSLCAPPNITENTNPTNVESKASIRAKKKMALILQLRAKMKEYHEALLLQSKVAQLQPPSERVLRAVKQMFSQDGYTVLDGQARGYLDADDLVALKSPTIDHLSNYLRKAMATKDKLGYVRDGGPRIKRFEERKITQWVGVITILVAIVFLVGPILALYFAQSR
ncbi:hypothetical protein O1611_g375 [Lasiodiplodia mahajangana]|uniref:Uncharacterized protein n=1 Tax=Lasiodiplodia mahajangana TaxID=1108764 RepID=A0ACC2K0D8_9PEZI|nr:hypothetical protein O1611_g375 [Lasiodiplodia mahajangana]